MSISIADLPTINYQELFQGNVREDQRLFEACKTWGFFYLDFRNGSVKDVLKTVEEMYQLAEEIFDLPLETKLEYDVDKIGSSKTCGQAQLSSPRVPKC